MKRLTFAAVAAVVLVGTAYAQRGPYNAATMSPYRAMPPLVGATPGNILNPGGVSAPLHPTLLGGTISGAIPYTGVRPGQRGPGPGRTIVVPYAVPVWSGGYYGAYYGMPQAQPNVTVVMPQQPAPSVIINQYSGSEGPRTVASTEDASGGGLQVYEANPRRVIENEVETKPAPVSTPAAARSYVRDDKPNIYLIALKDDTVRQAIGYWVEGGLLKYVTPQATISNVPLDMVDRNASSRLNSQNKLEFDLPPEIQ